MAITTSITVSFGNSEGSDGESNGHLSAEVDSRENGMNKGKTSFEAGDTVGFLVFKSSNVTYSSPKSSAGSIGGGGGGAVERTEEITFAGTDTASLSVPCSGIKSIQWIGNSLGSPALDSEDKVTLKLSSPGVGIAKITYIANADGYTLTSPSSLNGSKNFSIAIFIAGEVKK